MREKPKVGHMPDIYSLTVSTQIIEEYETYLTPRLALGTTIPPQTNQLEELRRENAELKAQLIKTNNLLTDLLSKSG